MKYKVIERVTNERVLCENLDWEDANAVMAQRTKNQLASNYTYHVIPIIVSVKQSKDVEE